MRYKEELVDELLQYLEDTLPYVEATIGPGCTSPSGKKDWLLAHEGRMISSRRQLEGIKEKINKLKAG